MNTNVCKIASTDTVETAIEGLERSRERIITELDSVTFRLERQSRLIANNPEKLEAREVPIFEESVLGRIESSNARMAELLERLVEVSNHIGRCVGEVGVCSTSR